MSNPGYGLGDVVKLDGATCHRLVEVLHKEIISPSISPQLILDFVTGEFIITETEYVSGSDRFVYKIRPLAMPDILINGTCFSKKFWFAEHRLMMWRRNSDKTCKNKGNIDSWRHYIKGWIL